MVYIHIVPVEWMLWIQVCPNFFANHISQSLEIVLFNACLRQNLMSKQCLCKKLHMRKMTEKVKKQNNKDENRDQSNSY